MHVAECDGTNAPEHPQALKDFVPVLQPDCVQPLAAHRYGRMVQANHDVLRGTANDDVGKAIELFWHNLAPGIAPDATVYADEQPIADFLVRTIGEWRSATNRPHQVANIVIARHAVGAELERQQQITKMIVRLRRVILDDVARYDDAMSAPVASSVVGEDLGKRSLRVGATQAAFRVGEQMRVRQVEDPN